jgi:predicted nuclease of predicted toxin-antitoxin system
VRFLVDRCAGRRLAEWLREQGHDVRAAWDQGPDPGDAELLRLAASEGRILVTIDSDFGMLVFLGKARPAGVVRLPDVIADRRIELMAQILAKHEDELARSIVVVRGRRIRISRPPNPDTSQ